MIAQLPSKVLFANSLCIIILRNLEMLAGESVLNVFAYIKKICFRTILLQIRKQCKFLVVSWEVGRVLTSHSVYRMNLN